MKNKKKKADKTPETESISLQNAHRDDNNEERDSNIGIQENILAEVNVPVVSGEVADGDIVSSNDLEVEIATDFMSGMTEKEKYVVRLQNAVEDYKEN